MNWFSVNFVNYHHSPRFFILVLVKILTSGDLNYLGHFSRKPSPFSILVDQYVMMCPALHRLVGGFCPLFQSHARANGIACCGNGREIFWRPIRGHVSTDITCPAISDDSISQNHQIGGFDKATLFWVKRRTASHEKPQTELAASAGLLLFSRDGVRGVQVASCNLGRRPLKWFSRTTKVVKWGFHKWGYPQIIHF